MKFNLKMFRNVLPKKSVLKKNKWVLVILALVILVGLYWYSKKSQENYYNSKGEGAWKGSKALKKGIDGEDLAPVRVDTLSEEDQINLLRFANHISGIRDVFYKVQNKNSEGGGPTSTAMFCTIKRLGSEVKDLNEYGTFIDINQKYTPPASIWTGTNGANQDIGEVGDCQDEYSELFTNHQSEIKKELLLVQAQLDQAKLEQAQLDVGAEPEYIDEMIHEQVTLYLGHTGCEHSNDFLTKIWTDADYKNKGVDATGENLRQTIIVEFPGIELDITPRDNIQPDISKRTSVSQDIIRCEHTDAVNKDRSATDNLEICKLAGFYTDPKDDKLSFPLIQYSFLGKTNKDRDSSDKGYTRYTANFDPTKKLGTNGEMDDEDVVGGVTKTVYTSQKILDWLSNLRGNGVVVQDEVA